jgi:hypothetical protein
MRICELPEIKIVYRTLAEGFDKAIEHNKTKLISRPP